MSNSSPMPVPSAVMMWRSSSCSRIRSRRCFSTFRIFPEREDRLKPGVAALFRGAAGGVALDHEQLGVFGGFALAVRQLPREARGAQRGLPARELLGFLGCFSGFRGFDGRPHDRLGGGGVLLEIRPQAVVDGALDDAPDFAVPEFGLGLALELGVGVFDGDDRSQPLPDVVAGEVLAVEFRQQAVVVGVVVDGARERRLEPSEMRATLPRVDVVRERVRRRLDVLGGLHGDLDGDAVVLTLEVDDVVVQRIAGLVEVFDELPDAALVLEGGLRGLVAALVGERDLDAGVQERQLTQPVFERGEVVRCRLEDLAVRTEPDERPGVVAIPDVLEVGNRFAALELLAVPRAVPGDFHREALGEGVHHGDADTV